MDQGRDLAATLGANRVALMRGHGCAVAGKTLREAVFTAIYLQVNAKLQTAAMNLSDEPIARESNERRRLAAAAQSVGDADEGKPFIKAAAP